MSKLFGAICLVAGTAIGAGMFAIPLTVSAVGFAGGLASMIVIWYVSYLVGLVGLELNLRAGRGLSLAALGALYGGKGGRLVGMLSLLGLTNALLAAYLFGGASVIKSFLASVEHHAVDQSTLTYGIAGFLAVILLSHIKWLDRLNRVLFVLMLVLLVVLIGGCLSELPLTGVLSVPSRVQEWSVWQVAMPVLMTSFGYHMIQNTLVDYCEQDPILLRRAFFWGSFMPLIVYGLWVVGASTLVFLKNPVVFQEILLQKMSLGDFMDHLSQAIQWAWLHQVVWACVFLAIITSAFGVGKTLLTFWEEHGVPNLFAVVVTLAPALLVAIWVPELFIKALGFAGLTVCVMSFFLPVYLVHRSNQSTDATIYPEVRNYGILSVIVVVALIMTVMELMNLG